MSETEMAQPSGSGLARRPFEFRGEASTYFLICIRTFLLAVVTLGIYDAWGTVERRRYMLGNTVVGGHGFDYHANPVTILIGRLIAVGVIVAINLIMQFGTPAVLPFLIFALLVLGFFGFPYIINRSLRFHIRNTSYRNVRFNFTGDYWKAFLVVSIAPMVIGMSFGVAYPWYLAKFQEYIFENLSLGRAKFSLDVPLGPLFKAFATMLLIALPVCILVGGFAYGFIVDGIGAAGQQDQFGAVLAAFMVVYVAFIALILCLVILSFILKAALRNTVLKNLEVQGGHRFDGNVTALRYGWIVLSRGFLATLSLGFLLPWATVQIHRFLMDHTVLLANGDLDRFVAAETDPGGAAVSEFGNLEGITDGVFSGI